MISILRRRPVVFCTVLVIAAVILRIINLETHWYNFAPLVAISLFSGAVIKQKSYAFLLPLSAYLISDLYMQLFTTTQGFYGVSQFFVYGAMILIVLFGSRMKQPKALRVLGFTLGSSLIFWIVSNFGVFVGGYWGSGLSGLTTTYLMALPFYSENGATFVLNAFAGDLIFSTALFGLYALYKNRVYIGNKAVAH